MDAEVKVVLNLRPISSLKNMPVLDLESGEVLGRVLDLVFNPAKQKLVAFVLHKGTMLTPVQVLVPIDVVEYGPKMILARNRNTIIHPKEVVGLPELMKNTHSIIGLIAGTETGKTLGKIDNLDIDTVSSLIQRYHVHPMFITGLTQPDLLIPADRFVRMDKNRMIFIAEADKSKIEDRASSLERETASSS
jgi:uncharacterized protein YrrD